MLKKSFLSYFEKIYHIPLLGWLEMSNSFKGTGFIIQCGLSHCWYKLSLKEKSTCGYDIKEYLWSHMSCGFSLCNSKITSTKWTIFPFANGETKFWETIWVFSTISKIYMSIIYFVSDALPSLVFAEDFVNNSININNLTGY